MKVKLLILTLLSIAFTNAQTTHNLDWFAGMGTNVDLTIGVGDTVIWTWTSPNHTVENVPGNSVETFNSGFLASVGSVFSFTFTVVGDNDYFCGVHGAGSMSGTITVEDNLSVNEEAFAAFRILKNPTSDFLKIELPQNSDDLEIFIHDVNGKKIRTLKHNASSMVVLDVSILSKGLYFITFKNGNGIVTNRFIKK